MSKTPTATVSLFALACLVLAPSAAAAGPAVITPDPTFTAEYRVIGVNTASSADRLAMFHLAPGGTQSFITDFPVASLTQVVFTASDTNSGGQTCVAWDSEKDASGNYPTLVCVPNL